MQPAFQHGTQVRSKHGWTGVVQGSARKLAGRWFYQVLPDNPQEHPDFRLLTSPEQDLTQIENEEKEMTKIKYVSKWMLESIGKQNPDMSWYCGPIRELCEFNLPPGTIAVCFQMLEKPVVGEQVLVQCGSFFAVAPRMDVRGWTEWHLSNITDEEKVAGGTSRESKMALIREYEETTRSKTTGLLETWTDAQIDAYLNQ